MWITGVLLCGKSRPLLVNQGDRSFSFVLTLFIFKALNYVLARTLTERVV